MSPSKLLIGPVQIQRVLRRELVVAVVTFAALVSPALAVDNDQATWTKATTCTNNNLQITYWRNPKWRQHVLQEQRRRQGRRPSDRWGHISGPRTGRQPQWPRGTPPARMRAAAGTSTWAVLLAASGQNCWPPTGSFVAAYGQDLMAADTYC